ncbi:hypothetical protein JHK82_027096 [Glycine max]|uniref:Uncharacterized protein n=2 Tax=Glycine subgen. Soja TaxID=1462606 RepID=K7LHR6_SOYBN|nr:hypothetical protein JHK85_027723 [Glycine max]KAG5003083.1 hypothetical protein JHK86_027222 [Glycine max]KAG5126261.1 hypothetical protein JHK82_027096 [Glycine max]KAH1137063.1 hypothetical protein GYH30_027162 [Glycine max]RZB85994.1 hypothetical protein D0Y65_026182 [Glycine soja]
MDDTEPKKYVCCENYWRCRIYHPLLSTFKKQPCRCGKPMSKVVTQKHCILQNGFVKERATFIICDDLSVLPNVIGTSVGLLRKLGIKDMDAIEECTVDMSKREKKEHDNFIPINQSQLEIGEKSCDEDRKIVVKLLVRTSGSKIMFAEAEEDFADLVCYCINKLYKRISELSPDRCLRSQEAKEKLANPPCAPKSNLHNQILPIDVACLPVSFSKLEFIDPIPKSSVVDSSSHGGFAKEPAMYMVTDDLVVTPISSISGVSYLYRSKVSLFDLKLVNFILLFITFVGFIVLGLAILKASLTSTSALTNGLAQLTKSIKRET